MLKKFVAVGILSAGLAWAAPASADVISFDPDGNTGGLGAVQINSLDWLPGNSVGVNVTAASPVGTTFQLYYQANLGVALDTNGDIVYTNNTGAAGALDSLSVVLGFQETITASTFDPLTNTGTLTFGFTAGGNNFFQIYANDESGNNLSGACFVCGQVVMSGSIVPDTFTSSFTANLAGSGGNLDQSADGDNYAGVDTIVGTGSVSLKAQVNSYDTNWFQGLNSSLITFAFANANTKLPYQEINPSACFFATTSTGGLAPTCTNSASNQTGVSPFIGVGHVGALNGVSGPNIMFQSDGNSSFLTTAAPVPEPATLTLLGVGLLGTAAARRRAKKANKQ